MQTLQMSLLFCCWEQNPAASPTGDASDPHGVWRLFGCLVLSLPSASLCHVIESGCDEERMSYPAVTCVSL